MILDGKEVDKAFDLDFHKDKFTRAYHSLLTAVGGEVGDNGLDLTKEDYMLLISLQIYVMEITLI